MTIYKFKIGETVFLKPSVIKISREARTSSSENCRNMLAGMNTG